MTDTEAALTVWGVGTTRTFRVHWVLHELGLDYEVRPIGSRTGETRTEEFTRLNPRQKIPVLQEGGLTLAESAAIVTHLAETRGEGTVLVPAAGSRARALYEQWCYFVMTELDAHTLYVVRKHRDLADLYGEAPAAVRAAEEGFAKQIGVVEQELARGGPFLLGDRFSGADVLLGSCLDWAVFYRLALGPALREYHARLRARPAYRAAFELNYGRRPEAP